MSALAKIPGSGAAQAAAASAATPLSSPVACKVSKWEGTPFLTDLDTHTMLLSGSMQPSKAFWVVENWFTGHMGADADWSCGLPVGVS